MAKGGVGLLIVEVLRRGIPLGIHHFPVQFHLDDDKYIRVTANWASWCINTAARYFANFSIQVPGSHRFTAQADTKSASTLTESELPGPGFAIPRGIAE